LNLESYDGREDACFMKIAFWNLDSWYIKYFSARDRDR